jgi:hypothetical protein
MGARERAKIDEHGVGMSAGQRLGTCARPGSLADDSFSNSGRRPSKFKKKLDFS